MNIEYTKPAKANLIDRKIPKKLVEETLKRPQQVVTNHGNRKIAQSIYKRNKKDFLLRIVYTEKVGRWIVITVYWTTKIKKYWEGSI